MTTKDKRQQLILDTIASEPIETQEQLLTRLCEQNIRSTQATISRDIKQLHLVKEPAGNGRYRYTVSAQKVKLNFADRLQTILRESIVDVDYAQNIVVLKTMPGLANAAAAAFDGMENSTMLGSLAGDDTVMVVMRSTEAAEEFTSAVKTMKK